MEGSPGVPGLWGVVSGDLQEVSPKGWWGRQAASRPRGGFQVAGQLRVAGAFAPRGNACLPPSDRGASLGRPCVGAGWPGEPGAEGSGQGCLVAPGVGLCCDLGQSPESRDIYGVAQQAGPSQGLCFQACQLPCGLRESNANSTLVLSLVKPPGAKTPGPGPRPLHGAGGEGRRGVSVRASLPPVPAKLQVPPGQLRVPTGVPGVPHREGARPAQAGLLSRSGPSAIAPQPPISARRRQQVERRKLPPRALSGGRAGSGPWGREGAGRGGVAAGSCRL